LAPPAEVWIPLHQALCKHIMRYDSCILFFTVKKKSVVEEVITGGETEMF